MRLKEKNMPIPVVVIAIAAAAGVAGAGCGMHGGIKIANAKSVEAGAKSRHETNMARFESTGNECNRSMDELGETELRILESFDEFVDVVSELQNAPTFSEIDTAGFELPPFDAEELRDVSVCAKATLGGLVGAAAGTAGGIAAAGATTTLIGALGTASTGTAIASLNGVAATNAILAWLGGGSLAAGGGGMALGTAVLGTATAGAAVLVAGVIMNFVGCKLSDDANELANQVDEEEQEVGRVCELLERIKDASTTYRTSLEKAEDVYRSSLSASKRIVLDEGKKDWSQFTEREKLVFQNTVLLVGLLFKMCSINVVRDEDGDGSIDSANTEALDEMKDEAAQLLSGLSCNEEQEWAKKICTERKLNKRPLSSAKS